MKKGLKFLWKSPKNIYLWINEKEANYLQKFNADYKSKLALHSFLFWVFSGIVGILCPLCLFSLAPESEFVLYIGLALPIIISAVYIVMYLRKRLPMIEGEKWKYCVMTTIALIFGAHAVLFPIYVLIGLLILAFYIVIIIIGLYIIFTLFIGAMTGDFGGGGRGKSKRWRTEDGETIREKQGLFGKEYWGNHGNTYEKVGHNEFKKEN